MPPGDVMKTPLLKDLSTLRRCNPPAFRLPAEAGLWPAIDKRSQLGFRCNLMSIPIEPAQLPVLFVLSGDKDTKIFLNYQIILPLFHIRPSLPALAQRPVAVQPARQRLFCRPLLPHRHPSSFRLAFRDADGSDTIS